MARFTTLGGSRRVYAPKLGKLKDNRTSMAMPAFSQDEVKLRLGVPDGLLTGKPMENIQHNPSYSEKQRRFMGAELARKRAGKKTRTGMSEGQLAEFAHKVR